MRRGLHILLLTVGTTLGCAAQPQGPVYEPVRFEDGTPVSPAEAGRLEQGWPERKLAQGKTLDFGIVYGDEAADALFDQDFLIADTTLTGEGDTLTVIRHACAFVRLQLDGLPAGAAAGRIDLIPTEGMWPKRAAYGPPAGKEAESGAGWTVTKGTLCQTLPGAAVSQDGSLVLWMSLLPEAWVRKAFAVVVHGDDGRWWSARLPGGTPAGPDLRSGTAYRWTATCVTPDALASDLRATPLPQTILDVEPGEYSGIAHISGNRYAVVDDNLKGGGIVFFSIPVGEDGSVGSVIMKPADGTLAATGKSLDCEGIAYVPSTGTLYVSTEKQEIRAYDLAGRETGQAFRIPDDLGLRQIETNYGFEALTYDAATGCFWTTTEAPLKSDTFLPDLRRLQRFDDRGEPAGRFLYQSGSPAATSAGATAHVFGIPALTALPDGRLIVLEREVYVPKGSFWDKLRDSFTKTDLYLVDPVHDTAGILRKTLLCSFRTGALDLANYEGMCLGPALPDGRRFLVLIADSQKGSGGLTQEYVKVILLR